MARLRTVGPGPRMEVDRPFRSIFGRLVATRFPQSVFGRRHDLRAASIVQAEPDLLDIGALCETPQEFGIGAGEAIDGLIDIADTKQSNPRARAKTEHETASYGKEVVSQCR